MNDQFESKIINLCVAQKDRSGLRNSRAIACVSRLDLDHFTQLQLKRQLVSSSFNRRLLKLSIFFLIFFTCIQFGSANENEIVIKSPIDQKQYRYLELENRLKVLLISDSETDKSAASLDVFIGSGSDPEEWDGLAHFLEHMLFLGTEKYPTAGEYQEFIKNNGGSNNAYTSNDHTNYYFSISPEYLEPALDRFSRFFIDPTFDEVYVDRERSVVHSEYQARKKDENRRLWDAQKKWLNSVHPSSGFSVGSLETLRDRKESSARDKLIEFYEQNYSANIMALTVIGKESLDQLEELVIDRFSGIPDRDASPLQFPGEYIDSELVPARLNSVPEKEKNSLRFVFPIPSTLAEYLSKPLNYISNLLGHEGDGSLYSILKNNGWAQGLSAGAGFMDNVQGEFSVSVQLTDEGLNHIEDIGELLFQAIALIKQTGIEKWRFEEQRKLSDIAFRFAQETDPGRLAQSLSSRLHRYPAHDVLRGPYVMELFEPDRILEILEMLHPGNVNIHVTSQLLDTDKVTKYYDVGYSLLPIADETLDRWKAAEVSESIALPDRNPFIPERLELLEFDPGPDIPRRVPTGSGVTLWYQPDNEFETPRANLYINIMSTRANASPENLVLTELYVRMINSQLTRMIYPAYLADLNYRLYRHARGISIRISGFEDKQSELLKIIVDALANPESDIDRFNVVKEGLQRELVNVSKDPPSSQVVHEIYRLLMRPYWTEQERIEVLKTATLEDVNEFVAGFYEKVNVNVLSHGDVSIEKSISRAAVLDALLVKSEFVEQIENLQIVDLDRQKKYLRSLSITHTDSALAIYFQGNDNTRNERARVSLLQHLLESPFYNQLRTVNRVGYIVNAGTISIDEKPGLLFSVQSPSHSPVQINKLYDEFITGFSTTLAGMEEQQFEQIKAGLSAKILRKDKNLADRTGRYWREIDLDEFQFNTRELFAEAVNALTLEDMQDFFDSNVLKRGAELLVQTTAAEIDNGEGSIQPDGFIETGDATVFRHMTHRVE
jgi:secreted Zn-dependent insulinase-like peptidase